MELTNEINFDDIIYYFKGSTARKRIDEFGSGIELFEKIKSGDMKFEETVKLQKI